MGVGRLIRRRAAYFFYFTFLRLQARGHGTAIRNATTVRHTAIRRVKMPYRWTGFPSPK